MTERQRLITKYISKLSKITAARYNLHFLQMETDESARHMLLENLGTIQRESGNQELANVIEKVSSGKSSSIRFGSHVEKPKMKLGSRQESDYAKKAKLDHLQQAQNSMSSLALEDALSSYKKAMASTKEKFYKQRAEICLALEKYRNAMAYATKGRFLDIAFVASIAEGDFEFAKNLFQYNIRSIEANQDNGTVVTSYELIHLLLFICFATKSSKEVQEVSDQIFSSTAFEVPLLRELTQYFVDRDFGTFLAHIPLLNELMQNSIYTSKSSNQLISKIRENVVVNEIEPFAVMRFDMIHEKLQIPVEEIELIIRKIVREGRVNGKIDLIKKMYIGGTADLQGREMEDMINRTVTIRQNFQLNLWKLEYNSLNTQKKSDAK